MRLEYQIKTFIKEEKASPLMNLPAIDCSIRFMYEKILGFLLL
jgi:hypothetical protein